MSFLHTTYPRSAVLLSSVGLGAAGISTGLVLSYPFITNNHFLRSVQTPGTKPLTTAQRLSLWWHSYTRGYCVPLFAGISLLSHAGLYGWHRGWTRLAGRWELVGAAAGLQFAIFPWTFALIMPVNKRLHSLLQSANANLPVDETEVDRLMGRWTTLHAARVTSLIAGLASYVLALTL